MVAGASVSLVMSVIILALASVVVANTTPVNAFETKQNQTVLGCSGTVVALAAVGIVLSIVSLIMYAPGTKSWRSAVGGYLTNLPGGRSLSSGSSLFASLTPASY
jgi:ABC-type uncharacterized transport system permease subunit